MPVAEWHAVAACATCPSVLTVSACKLLPSIALARTPVRTRIIIPFAIRSWLGTSIAYPTCTARARVVEPAIAYADAIVVAWVRVPVAEWDAVITVHACPTRVAADTGVTVALSAGAGAAVVARVVIPQAEWYPSCAHLPRPPGGAIASEVVPVDTKAAAMIAGICSPLTVWNILTTYQRC